MDQVVSIVGILLAVLGAMLSTFTTLLEKRRPALELKGGNAGGAKKPTAPPRISRSGVAVLSIFAAIVVIYGLFTLIWYWQEIRQQIDDALFLVWLLLIMVAGMFSQVLVSNYRNGHPLLSVNVEQLIFPLLLAPIVFFSIWTLAASAPRNGFALYAAFVNGFFWEAAVASTKGPIQANPVAEH
jgi:hypothetical protein